MNNDFRTNNFDLLRIFAATQVLIHHTYVHLHVTALSAWEPLTGAFHGVPIFFVISGFLISASFERNANIRSYARNRFFRIYPGLWCCIFLTIATAGYFGFNFPLLKTLTWGSSQLVGIIYTPSFLKSFGFGSYNGSLWTIPIELQFYVVLPILYWFINRALNGRNITQCIGVIFISFTILAFITRLYIHEPINLAQEPLPQKLLRYSFIPHIYLFLFGVLLQRLNVHNSRLIYGKGIYWLIIYILIYSLIPYSAASYISLTLILGIAVISIAYTKPHLSRKLLKGTDISYGTYIYHGLLINIFVTLGLTTKIKYIALLLVLTYLVAYFSWILVERPMMKRKTFSLKPRN